MSRHRVTTASCPLCPQKRQAFAETMFILGKAHNEQVLLVTLRTPRLIPPSLLQ